MPIEFLKFLLLVFGLVYIFFIALGIMFGKIRLFLSNQNSWDFKVFIFFLVHMNTLGYNLHVKWPMLLVAHYLRVLASIALKL